MNIICNCNLIYFLYRSGVLQMLLTKYNRKELLKLAFEDSRRQGFSEGFSEGFQKGFSEGLQKGQAELERVLLLIRLLLADNRIEDSKRMSEDSDFRNKLLDEYCL